MGGGEEEGGKKDGETDWREDRWGGGMKGVPGRKERIDGGDEDMEVGRPREEGKER